MTSFTNKNLWMSGDCLVYSIPGEPVQFIARFKYGKRGVAPFKKFLMKNFTVEEYLGEMDKRIPPLRILESKGYVSPQKKRLSQFSGIPATSEGLERYFQQVR